MKLVTAVLMTYKREPNVPKIINALRNQTIAPEIWLINNDGCQTFGEDRSIHIPWNAGEWARYAFTRRVETDWFILQDDDWLIGDDRYIEDAIKIACEKAPNHLTGAMGRGLNTSPPYYSPDIFSGYAPILKGSFIIGKRASLSPLHVAWHPSASDIYFSLDLSRGRRTHWVDEGLRSRLAALDTHGRGYEFRAGHWKEREETCKAYIQEYGVDI